MFFIPVMVKLNFQQSLLLSSVSHDPSEIILIWWFGALETLLSMLKTVMLFNVLWKSWYICFRVLWWIESSKEQPLFLVTKKYLLSLLINLKYHKILPQILKSSVIFLSWIVYSHTALLPFSLHLRSRRTAATAEQCHAGCEWHVPSDGGDWEAGCAPSPPGGKGALLHLHQLPSACSGENEGLWVWSYF